MSNPFVQAVAWLWLVVVALAFFEQLQGKRQAATAMMTISMIVALVGVIVMAVTDVRGDPLNNCRETGGSQMVYVDGGWQCVPPGQEG